MSDKLAEIKKDFFDAKFDYHTVRWLIDEVERLRAERDELVTALRPFAQTPFDDTDKYLVGEITGRQVNDARELLARIDAGEEG